MELVFYGLIGSVLSLIGGLVLLWHSAWIKKIMIYLLAFAAGTFLAVSFLDLLPEAVEMVAEPHLVFIAFIVGVALFFGLERVLMTYFHGRGKGEHSHSDHMESISALLIVGDSLHNFLDGVVIAVAYVANPALGLTTALAVAAHEVPQEVADFGILLDRGWSKGRIILVNLLCALASLLGVWVGYAFITTFEGLLPYVLAGVAGIFSYIALSDVIPEVHHRAGHKHFFEVWITFIAGLVLVGYLIMTTHG